MPFYRARVFETIMMKQCTQLGTRNDKTRDREEKGRSKKVGEKSRKSKKKRKGDKNNEKGRMNFFG